MLITSYSWSYWTTCMYRSVQLNVFFKYGIPCFGKSIVPGHVRYIMIYVCILMIYLYHCPLWLWNKCCSVFTLRKSILLLSSIIRRKFFQPMYFITTNLSGKPDKKRNSLLISNIPNPFSISLYLQNRIFISCNNIIIISMY